MRQAIVTLCFLWALAVGGSTAIFLTDIAMERTVVHKYEPVIDGLEKELTRVMIVKHGVKAELQKLKETTAGACKAVEPAKPDKAEPVAVAAVQPPRVYMKTKPLVCPTTPRHAGMCSLMGCYDD